jgi:hypothetical protein
MRYTGGYAEGKERALAAKERLRQQANPVPIVPTQKRVLHVQNASVGAGKDKGKEDEYRALTLVEQMYNEERRRKGNSGEEVKRTITFAMVSAADRYREIYLDAAGSSAGVGSYGQSPGGSVPWDKSGTTDGQLRNRGCLADARFAMCGVMDEDGRPSLDTELLNLMEVAIVETTDDARAKRLMMIGATRTAYLNEKLAAVAGGTVVAEALQRLVSYWGYTGRGMRQNVATNRTKRP